MFIGRASELDFLQQHYESNTGELIVLYGRRRVGKTETLRKFCEGKPHVFYACTETPDEQQLTAFSERMLQKGLPAAQYINRFSDWQSAFAALAELPSLDAAGKPCKKLLVIDEFPYMAKGNRSIPSILQNLWDETLKNQNVMLILCGSAMSFIEKELLAEKNPLYGRATGILKMNELSFYEAAQFFPAYSVEEKIVAYGILGGIPHYLKQFNPSVPLAENMKRNILMRGSILYSEVEFLMRQELRETSVYNAIVEAVALGNTKLNDIYQKTQIEKSKLSVYLKNLVDLGILCREFSMEDGVKEKANVQRGLYQITDNFFRFWYAFVFPNLSELESDDAEGVWQYVVQPELEKYTSYIFEDVCRQYLRGQNRTGSLPFRFTKMGRWWNKSDELDIMAVNRDKSAFLLGECKYKNTAFTSAEYKKTKAKFTPSRSDASCYYYLFSKNGFAPEVLQAAKAGDCVCVTLEDLME